MKGLRGIAAGAAVLLGGCGTVKDIAMTPYDVTHHVAVQTYRVATTPIRALRRHSDESAMATTTEAMPSDVSEAGEPVSPPEVASAPQQQPPPRRYERESAADETSTAPRVTRREATRAKPKPSPRPQVASAQTEFPTAKAVPGKPGYVFSPFDANARYVDVSGYAPGTKVKDPWTDKIFIVP
jgi:hypothetical protein